MMESDVRRILDRTWKPGRKPSAVFLSTLALAVREILYVQVEGHRVPRARDFDFDDDGTAT